MSEQRSFRKTPVEELWQNVALLKQRIQVGDDRAPVIHVDIEYFPSKEDLENALKEADSSINGYSWRVEKNDRNYLIIYSKMPVAT